MNIQFQSAIELLEASNFYYIIIAGMQGTYTYINPNYARTFNYIDKSLVGKPYYITMHPDDRKVCEEVSAKCFTHPGQMFPATIRKLDGKGGYIITQWEYKAMFDDNNKPEGIFCLGYDITRYVDEQKMLNEAKTKIKEKQEILKEIAFQHSHLIRSPLSNIMGLALILDKMEMDANLKNIISLMVESCNKVDKITREVVGKSYK